MMPEQMWQIHDGLLDNLDVSIFADPIYDWDQMFEICEGLKDDLDVSVYADPKINSDQMRHTRWELETQQTHPEMRQNKPTGKGLER
jgi:hypothetical protein